MQGKRQVQTILTRGTLAVILWWIISEGDTATWAVGLPAIILAVLFSLYLQPASRYRLSLPGLLPFGCFFLQRSLLAGLDIARRILSPKTDLQPGNLSVALRLPEGAPRWLLAMTLSLLPGTVSLRFEADTLTLHCLDLRYDVERELRQAELRVAALFGLSLETPGAGTC